MNTLKGIKIHRLNLIFKPLTLGGLILIIVYFITLAFDMVVERDMLISERGGVLVFLTMMTLLVISVIGFITAIDWFWHNPDIRITKRVITGPDDPMLNALSESNRRTIIEKTVDEIVTLRFIRKKELEKPAYRFLGNTQGLIEEKENVLRAVGVEDIEAEIKKPQVSFEALSHDEKVEKGMILFEAERWFQPILFG